MFFKRATIISEDEDTELFVNILAKSGKFEIFESGELVATGTIRGFEKLPSTIEAPDFDGSNLVLKRSDFYKEFMFRKQECKSFYRAVFDSDVSGRNCRIEWKSDMSSFLECMSQLTVFQFINLRGIILLTYLERMTVDPVKFLESTSKNTGNSLS